MVVTGLYCVLLSFTEFKKRRFFFVCAWGVGEKKREKFGKSKENRHPKKEKKSPKNEKKNYKKKKRKMAAGSGGSFHQFVPGGWVAGETTAENHKQPSKNKRKTQ